ncbi:hypothetical protein [Saccharicrinis sp. 156]|uniref:hypothetical protein n=1 Tax=Saccharicrinis sp. 156 TaxID=3417574 RepID=UPI003D32B816
MNNRKTAGSFQLIFTFGIIIFAALFVCSLTIDVLMHIWLQWTSGFIAALIVYFFVYGGYYYFEIDKVDDHFEVRFYNSFPFGRDFKMFRVPITAFIKYEINGNKFYRKKLLLYQMSSSQLAKYPPIYITAFSSKDLNDLKKFFASIK